MSRGQCAARERVLGSAAVSGILDRSGSAGLCCVLTPRKLAAQQLVVQDSGRLE